ncbi:hypothetical protein [Thalassomonas sp. M1454]|uniref:hypothetical protein n=1 Tax=Thalassomonas sp. M1454 TaxID=2594477 RepID=UPI001180B413|nr:hypothetical protein [Thalassomonas sp. M1454]TRX55048.1 hypothetical protein FNN08_10635 [Thalassomonas sp. M1454]
MSNATQASVNTNGPIAGPVIGASLVCADIDAVSRIYQANFSMSAAQPGVISKEQADFWQSPHLAGAEQIILTSPSGANWLRLISDKTAEKVTPLANYGWMSLEVNVANVDQCAAKLSTDFSVLGAPANLELSDAIKAMQVAGPVGEVLYLTEIKAAVPPFELPMTDAELDCLFIPVLKSPDRAASLAFYEHINSHKGLSFDTKITVLNRYHNIDISHQYPVATLQFKGESLIEIDQVESGNSNSNAGLPAGIALMTLEVSEFPSDIDELASLVTVNDSYYGSSEVKLYRGPAGELVELVLKNN